MADTLILYRDQNDAGLDLSAYVDVAGGGINPGDGEIITGVFIDGKTSTGFGPVLAGSQRSNRAFQVPLLLSGSTRDALIGLIRVIQERLDGAAPMVEWKQDGASASTFFPVKFGRILGSERYDFYRERVRVAKRLLDLVCSPAGEGTRRTAASLVSYVASGAGWASSLAPSNPAAFPLPSIGGDLPAGFRIAVSHGGGPTRTRWGGFAWGLTWQPSYCAGFLTGGASYLRMWDGTLYGPTSYLAASGIPGGAATAIQGQAVQIIPTYEATGANVPYVQIVNESLATIASYAAQAPWPGRYRAYVLGRDRMAVAGDRVQLRLRDPFGNVGPVATMGGPSVFSWLDMGDVIVGATALDFRVQARIPSTATVPLASPAVNIAAVALIPRDVLFGQFNHTTYDDVATMAWIVDGLEVEKPFAAGGRIGVGSITSVPIRAASGAWAYEMPYLGRRPQAPYTPSGVATGPLLVALGFAAPGEEMQPEKRLAVRFVLQDRYRFAK